jgi:hypothetical protein
MWTFKDASRWETDRPAGRNLAKMREKGTD